MDPTQALRDRARLAALADTGLLEVKQDPALDRLARLARRLLGADTALVSLLDAEKQVFPGAAGLEGTPAAAERRGPLSHSYCKYVVATRAPLVIEDARLHPFTAGNPAIEEDAAIAYAGVPLHDAGGNVLGSFCVVVREPRAWSVEDVEVLNDLADAAETEIELRRELRVRSRIEDELARAVAVADNANAAKSEFLANMSHELRTPLNSVIGFTRVLLRRASSKLEAGEVQYLERIRANGEHLLSLINEVLDLAKVESGRLELQKCDLDAVELIASTVEELRGRVTSEAVRFEAILPARAEPVCADPFRLKQVLINLLSNALKFTEHGSVTVRLEVDADGTPLRIVVQDTGIGIPADRLAAIFEPFTQADGGTERRFGGTGLGLAISRALCELMGFRLEVRSQEGAGSTFTLVLQPE